MNSPLADQQMLKYISTIVELNATTNFTNITMTWFKAAEPNLPELLRMNARWRPAKAAVISAGTTWNWEQTAAHAARMACALDQLGLRKGDRVVLLMNNGLPMLQAIFGAVWGGYVAVPLNTSVADEGIAKMIADSDAAVVIASDEHVDRIVKIHGSLNSMNNLHRVTDAKPPAGWLSLQSILDAADDRRPVESLKPDDLCNIIYSSGTTGMPKGIVHSHGCRMAWAYDMSIALRYDSDARTLI